MQSIPFTSALTIFILLTTLTFSGSLNAQDFIINNYDIELKLTPEGSFDIREQMDVVFLKKSRGIKKSIPTRIKHNGFVNHIGLTNVDVVGDNFKVFDKSGRRIIQVGDKDKYIVGPKSYDYSYRIPNAVLHEKTHAELYYDLVSGWDVPIEKVTYSIILHDTLTMALSDYIVNTGASGGNNKDATIQKIGKRLFGESIKPLNANENITVALKLPLGFVNTPEVTEYIPVYKKDKLWAIPLALLGAFIAFFIRSRKDESDNDISDKYFPPVGFSPAEVGTYYDGIVHTEDIVSLLPYWAQQGYISITNNNMEGKENDIYFRKIKNLSHGTPEYQKIVFNGLFEEGSMVMLSELKNEIYRSHYKAEKEIKDNLKRKDLYDQEYYEKFKTGKLIFLFFILFAAAVLIFILTPYVITGLVTILAGLVSFVFHFVPAKKSKKGIVIKNHLLGLRNFLKNIDAEKTEDLLLDHPNYFEDIFPYAVAFGLEKSWLEKIESLDLDAPSWYAYEGTNGTSTATMASFSKDFSIPTIKSVFTSAPASTSGASSGGGFSGGSAGGGIGGGGSSW